MKPQPHTIKSGEINVNMRQFCDRFKVYADNVHLFETVKTTGGAFYSLDLRPLLYWLDMFGIFYTVKMRA